MSERATKVAYRTTHPDAFAAWHAAADASEKWAEEMEAFLAEHGFGKRAVYIAHWGRVLGVRHIEGENVPDGWRVDSRTGHLMPRLAVKAGKQIDARLAELRQPDPRDALPGMPKECHVSLALLKCGLEVMGDALYATWSLVIPEDQVDLTIWERLKLSEYYAAKEAHEESPAVQADPQGGETRV